MKHKFKQLAAVLQRLILTRFILGGFFIFFVALAKNKPPLKVVELES